MDAPRQEVPEIVEVAVLLVLDIDETPAVLPASDGLAVNDDVPLASDHCKGDEGLRCGTEGRTGRASAGAPATGPSQAMICTHPDGLV